MLERCHKRAEEMDRLQVGATNFLSSWSTLPKKLKEAHRYRLEEQKYADARIVALLKERGLGGNHKKGEDTDDVRKTKGKAKREREKKLKEERSNKEVDPATRAKNGPCTAWAKSGTCKFGVACKFTHVPSAAGSGGGVGGGGAHSGVGGGGGNKGGVGGGGGGGGGRNDVGETDAAQWRNR